jgi:hypothetical protein
VDWSGIFQEGELADADGGKPPNSLSKVLKKNISRKNIWLEKYREAHHLVLFL